MLHEAAVIHSDTLQRVDVTDGLPVAVHDDEAVRLMLSGKLIVDVLVHYTETGPSSIASNAADTPAARRFNWVTVASLCAERLTMPLERAVVSEAMCGAHRTVAGILHQIALRVNGGAFAERSPEMEAARAQALIAPLQQQAAMMALVIQNQQRQWNALQRAQELALVHQRQLIDCASAEAAARHQMWEWRRYDLEELFPALSLVQQLWWTSRELHYVQEAHHREALREQQEDELAPLAVVNFRRLGRLEIELREEAARIQLVQGEDTTFRDVSAQHSLNGVERVARSAVVAAEVQAFDDVLRRIYCYFETIVGEDALRMQEHARREVLQNYWLGKLRDVALECERVMPKRLRMQLKAARSFTDSSAGVSKRSDMFWRTSKPIPAAADSTTAASSSAAIAPLSGAQAGRWRRPNRTIATPTPTERTITTPSSAGPGGKPIVAAGPDGRLRLTEYAKAPVPSALAHLSDAEPPRSGTPPPPPPTPAPYGGRSRPASQASTGPEPRWHRKHLPTIGYKSAVAVQTACRYRIAFRYALDRFFRRHFRVVRLVQRRMVFASIQLPRLLAARRRRVAQFLDDGITFNRAIGKLVMPTRRTVRRDDGDDQPKRVLLQQDYAEAPPRHECIASAVVKRAMPRCSRCVPIILAACDQLPHMESLREAPTVDARWNWEAALLKHAECMCDFCGGEWLAACGVDDDFRQRHAYKALLAPVVRAPRALHNNHDVRNLMDQAVRHYPYLQPLNVSRAVAAVTAVQRQLRWRRAQLYTHRREVWQWERVRFSPAVMGRIRGMQVRFKLRVRRKRLAAAAAASGARVPCLCTTVLSMLQRRVAASWGFYVPMELEKKLRRRKLLSDRKIVEHYEPWIVHHKPHTSIPGDALHIELLHTQPECTATRDAYHRTLEQWRRNARFGLWIFQRLKVRVYYRQTRNNPDRHVCVRAKHCEPHCSPDVLDLFETRVRSFPGFCAAPMFATMLERFRGLVCRTCAECTERFDDIVAWARDISAIGSFVRLRFQFVIRRRDEAQAAHLARMEPFARRDDWSLCKRCVIFIQGLRQHLTFHPMLSEERVARYTELVCVRCAPGFNVTVAPYLRARHAAVFFQDRFRWRLAWRRGVRAKARAGLAAATRGGCGRCDPVVTFLRRRVAHCIARGVDLDPREKASYLGLMCSDKCTGACNAALARAEQHVAIVAALETDASADKADTRKAFRQLPVEAFRDVLRLHAARSSPDAHVCATVLQSVLRAWASACTGDDRAAAVLQRPALLAVHRASCGVPFSDVDGRRVALAAALDVAPVMQHAKLEASLAVAPPRQEARASSPQAEATTPEPSAKAARPAVPSRAEIEASDKAWVDRPRPQSPCPECGAAKPKPGIHGDWCPVCGTWRVRVAPAKVPLNDATPSTQARRPSLRDVWRNAEPDAPKPRAKAAPQPKAARQRKQAPGGKNAPTPAALAALLL